MKMCKIAMGVLLTAGVALAGRTSEVRTRVVGGSIVSTPASGSVQDVSGSTVSITNITGHVCVDNTTSAILTNDQVFTGAWQDMKDYGVATISVNADQGSATDGLVIQWSQDGTNVSSTDTFTILADNAKTFTFGPADRYIRLKYTNGGVTQTSFFLSTVLRAVYVKPSSHRINDAIVGQDDAELVKAVLSGEDPDGTFQNVSTTVDGNLVIADNSSGLAIAKGDITGHSFVHKFGNFPDADTDDSPVTVWDGANDAAALDAMDYTYSATADIDSLVSSDNTDGQVCEVQGLGATTNLVVQNVTLNGTNRVALSTNLYRVFRIKNEGATDFAGNVSCYVTNSPLAAGVVVDETDLRAVVLNGNNQTEMALYTVPAGKTAYMRDWYASIGGANKTSNYVMELYARKSGGVFQLKHKIAISDGGVSYMHHKFAEPEVFVAGTDIEIRCTITAAGVTAASVSAGFDLVLVDD